MSLDFYLEHDVCPHCGHAPDGFACNITHNLGRMAEAAGVYQCLWHPPEGTRAKDIVPALRAGLADLKARPDHFAQFNAPNGWGMYEHFVPFVQEVLTACEASPEALVRAST